MLEVIGVILLVGCLSGILYVMFAPLPTTKTPAEKGKGS